MNTNEKRRRRAKRRKRTVLIERIILLALIVLVLGIGAFLIYENTPGIKLNKHLSSAHEALSAENYDEAKSAAENALTIDETSVEAYRVLSQVYLGKDDFESAVNTLKQGYETTSDETLLNEYCVHTLNQVVADINGCTVTLDTIARCIEVFRNDSVMQEAYTVFDEAYERLFDRENETLLCNRENISECNFDRYIGLLNEFIEVCENDDSYALRDELVKLSTPKTPLFYVEVRHLDEYAKTLDNIIALDSGNAELLSLKECVDTAISAQNTFAPAFDIFESDNFAPIRDFMQSDEYIKLRDEFLNGGNTCWAGETYIPVSRDFIKLMYDDGYSFSFTDFKEYEKTDGVISIWATKQSDDGVLRLVISYEPAEVSGEYLPHITYEVLYLYSNVKINGQYAPRMNYRFETRTATAEGTTTTVIGDWGGEYEWEDEF